MSLAQGDGAGLQALIGSTLDGKYPLLRFPAQLEENYRAHHERLAHGILARMLPWVTLLYGLATLVMYAGSPAATWNTWLQNALVPVTLAIGWMWIAHLTGLLGRAVHVHTLAALSVALFASTRTIFLLGEAPGVQYVTYQVIYLLFILYTVAQLRLPQALGATIVVAVALLAVATANGLAADWLDFGQYYVATTLISAVIGYIMEHRERGAWLRSQRSALEQQALQALQRAADADARRRRIQGDYLELVAGNLTATEVAGRTLKFLMEHLRAQVGTVYLAEGERMRRAAGWGLDGEARLAHDIGRGETLIGQAAENGRRMRLSHVPAGYHEIRTATGSAPPAELLIEPVRHQDATLAVIELGALAHFSDTDLELLDRIARAMSAALVAAHARDALARAGMTDFNI